MRKTDDGHTKIKAGKAAVAFNAFAYTFLAIFTIFCVLPFIMLISGSLSSEQSIVEYGYGILPKDLSLEAYKLVFKNPVEIVRAYGVTLFVTAAGTVLGVLVTALTGYVLSRKDFKYRNQFAFYFYFTTLFNGGLLSTYIFFVQYLKLKDSYLSLILPLLINVFYLLIMRSFMTGIPATIIESAKIDGAGELQIFFKFALPLTKAGLTTIGLFILLSYWNDWYNAMLYISDYRKYPLQYLLYNMLSATEAISRLAVGASISMVDMPSNSLKMAMAVISIGPVLVAYPFVQKFFTKGITIGAVKG